MPVPLTWCWRCSRRPSNAALVTCRILSRRRRMLLGRVPCAAANASTWRLTTNVDTEVTTGTLQHLGHPLTPRSDRVGDHVVGPLRTEHVEFVAEHFRGGAHQQPRDRVGLGGHLTEVLQERVAVRLEPGSRVSNPGREGLGGEVHDFFATFDERPHQRQRWVRVAVKRQAEKQRFRHEVREPDATRTRGFHLTRAPGATARRSGSSRGCRSCSHSTSGAEDPVMVSPQCCAEAKRFSGYRGRPAISVRTLYNVLPAVT